MTKSNDTSGSEELYGNIEFHFLPGVDPAKRRIKQTLDRLITSISFKLFKQEMVEVNGIEPMTSCLQSRRSPS